MEKAVDWEKCNEEILQRISCYLNSGEKSIDKHQVKKVSDCGVSQSKAVELLFAGYLDLDLFLQKEYLPYMLKKLDIKDYIADAYYKDISFDNAVCGDWELKKDCYAPYEIFVRDDFVYDPLKVLPQLGYFNEEFQFPAVYQNGVLWMSVTPNEINTMKSPVERAKGKVLTFGLGLGYFAYMCSLKEEVESVTVVEKDESVIRLFNEIILPQFSQKDKVKIDLSDAYDYLNGMRDGEFDYAFVDIYHDAGDGREIYRKFKKIQSRFSLTEFDYWIEKTIKYYL